ncbi:MAG: 30S ribosomal protein S12 methylthiotransferase RimO [Coriobacteriales bacterium]|nr:30S ribosomal protein S12 methylthiotransferase RimO [Coriobacteriales bacterium]
MTTTNTNLSGIRCLFVTLGCAKNEVDTDRMRALLLDAGASECYEVDEADVAIVNTCSFLAAATQESIETTLQIADQAKAGIGHLPIVMCGCMPSRYGSELEAELPEVAAFVRADEEDGIQSVVARVTGRADADPQPLGNEVLRTIQGASAYVKISDGCDRFCAFCAIPYIRGRYWSREPEEIAREVHALMEGGVREIVLIGQDTGVWGCDLGDNLDLAWLLRRLAREVRPYGGWIRVLYLQPEGMTDSLVEVLRDVDEVLPYVDIPIQHCNERVLRSMRRTGSAQEFKELFQRLRDQIPGMVLRSTGLVGYPGETETEFEELVDFVDQVGFDYTSVFAYSQEEGTVAARLPQQIEEDEKVYRTQRLLDVAEQLGFAATASHVGEVVDVIIDGVEETDQGAELVGHAWFQAPDCDGAVHIESGEAAVGDKVRCRLVDSFCYELVGIMLKDEQRG